MSKADDSSQRRRKRIEEEDNAMDVDNALWEDEDARPNKKKKENDGDIDDVLKMADDDEVDEEEDDDDEDEDEEDEDEDGDEDGEDDEDEEEEDGWDEDLYGGDEDRAHLMSLPELEREQILFDRGEKRKANQERRKAQREAKKKKSSSTKKKKSKSKKKKSSRAPTKRTSEKRTAKDALADLLARKTQKIRSKASDLKSFDQDEEEEEDEHDDDDDDDEPTSARKRKSRARREKDDFDSDEDVKDVADDGAPLDDEDESTRTRTPVQYAHIKSIQLRRAGLEKILDEPYFNDVVIGMFVRLKVGLRDDLMTTTYKLCQVVGVHEMLKYKFGVPLRDVKVGLLLKHGRGERVWACSLISNSSVTPEEFDKWKRQCENDKVTMPTAEDTLRLKRKATLTRQNFQYSPEVIAKLFEERRQQGKGITRASNLTAERSRLEFELNQARDGKDADKLARVQRQLDELKEAELRLQQLTQSRSSIKGMYGILDINRRNVAENTAKMESMMKMQREEKRREAEEARRQMELTGSRPAPAARDAFKRKETRPTMEFIADAENAAEQNKAALAAEKAKKEAEKKAQQAEQAKLSALAKKNRLEHFDDLSELKPDQTQLMIEQANTRTLYLPSHQSVSEKLSTLLAKAYKSIDLHIDGNASTPATTMPSVIGRFLTPGGGFNTMQHTSDKSAFSQPPQGGRVFSVDEYRRRREQMA